MRQHHKLLFTHYFLSFIFCVIKPLQLYEMHPKVMHFYEEHFIDTGFDIFFYHLFTNIALSYKVFMGKGINTSIFCGSVIVASS